MIAVFKSWKAELETLYQHGQWSSAGPWQTGRVWLKPPVFCHISNKVDVRTELNKTLQRFLFKATDAATNCWTCIHACRGLLAKYLHLSGMSSNISSFSSWARSTYLGADNEKTGRTKHRDKGPPPFIAPTEHCFCSLLILVQGHALVLLQTENRDGTPWALCFKIRALIFKGRCPMWLIASGWNLSCNTFQTQPLVVVHMTWNPSEGCEVDYALHVLR